MSDDNQLIQERREKLQALRAQAQANGTATFPNDFKPKDRAAQLHQAHAAIEKEAFDADIAAGKKIAASYYIETTVAPRGAYTYDLTERTKAQESAVRREYSELFDANVRYSGSGIGYNLAAIVGAAFVPTIATWLSHHWGVHSVGLYLGVMALCCLIAVLSCKETKNVDFTK